MTQITLRNNVQNARTKCLNSKPHLKNNAIIFLLMDQKMLDLIAKIISPYLKTKHKEKESHELARRILEEINKDGHR
jgi:hypothetical protein